MLHSGLRISKTFVTILRRSYCCVLICQKSSLLNTLSDGFRKVCQRKLKQIKSLTQSFHTAIVNETVSSAFRSEECLITLWIEDTTSKDISHLLKHIRTVEFVFRQHLTSSTSLNSDQKM